MHQQAGDRLIHKDMLFKWQAKSNAEGAKRVGFHGDIDGAIGKPCVCLYVLV